MEDFIKRMTEKKQSKSQNEYFIISQVVLVLNKLLTVIETY